MACLSTIYLENLIFFSHFVSNSYKLPTASEFHRPRNKWCFCKLIECLSHSQSGLPIRTVSLLPHPKYVDKVWKSDFCNETDDVSVDGVHVFLILQWFFLSRSLRTKSWERKPSLSLTALPIWLTPQRFVCSECFGNPDSLLVNHQAQSGSARDYVQYIQSLNPKPTVVSWWLPSFNTHDTLSETMTYLPIFHRSEHRQLAYHSQQCSKELNWMSCQQTSAQWFLFKCTSLC